MTDPRIERRRCLRNLPIVPRQPVHGRHMVVDIARLMLAFDRPVERWGMAGYVVSREGRLLDSRKPRRHARVGEPWPRVPSVFLPQSQLDFRRVLICLGRAIYGSRRSVARVGLWLMCGFDRIICPLPHVNTAASVGDPSSVHE